MNDTDLAAAVASRICHDLVSPVGAVANGVDLMREMGGSDPEAANMIGQSAGRASALLQFYRMAFGAAAEEAQPVSRGSLRELAAVLAQPPRITLNWEGDGPPLARREARLLALMLMCARSVTGMRGAIRLRMAAGTALPAMAAVEAEAFSSTAGMLDLLDGGAVEDPLSPRAVEFVLAREAAAAIGATLGIERNAGQLVIQAGE